MKIQKENKKKPTENRRIFTVVFKCKIKMMNSWEATTKKHYNKGNERIKKNAPQHN